MTKQELAEQKYPHDSQDYISRMATEIKREAFLAGFDAASEWVRIEEGCEMPDIFKPNPNFSIRVLVTDGEYDYGELRTECASYNFTAGYWSYPPFEPTHWKRIVPPTE